jgi:outer membrane protein assembly factor BamB
MLAAVLLCALSTAQAGDASSSDWPQWLGPSRNGASPTSRIASTWPGAGPHVIWKHPVGQGFSAPVVSGAKLIITHRIADNEVVECLESETGQTTWSSTYPTHYRDDFGFDEGPRATPAIANGKVYTFGAEGVLNCWDLGSGRNLWSANTKSQFRQDKGFFGIACSPLVEGGAVILNVGGADNAGIVAFDKTTGRVLWKADSDEASYSSPTAATIAGKRYVFVFTRAGLVALDPQSGTVYFRFPWRSRMNASVNAATPLVIDDCIFLSASYGAGAALLRFHEKGPEKIWTLDDAMSNHYATCVHRDGFLYGFHGRQETGPSLRCIELKTGKVRWNQDNFGAGSILLAGDHLLIVTEKGRLICAPATPDGYKPAAEAQVLGGEVRAYPCLAGNRFYVRNKDTLVCLDLGESKP